MQAIIDWIVQNKEWLFSGIGLAAIALLFKLYQLIFLERASSASPKNQTEKNLDAEPQLSLTIIGGRGHRFEFADGVIAYTKISGSWHITDVFKFSAHFQSHEKCAEAMAPTVHSLAAHHLEKYSYESAKQHRVEVADVLAKEMAPKVAQFGISLDGITIAPFRRASS